MTFDEYNTDENFDKKESSLDELVKLGVSEGKTSDEIKKSLSPKWQKSKKIGEFDTYFNNYTAPKVEEKVTEENKVVTTPPKEDVNLKKRDKEYLDNTNAKATYQEQKELDKVLDNKDANYGQTFDTMRRSGEIFRNIDDHYIENLPTFMFRRYQNGEFGDPNGKDAKLRLAYFMMNGLQSKLKNAANAASMAAGRGAMFSDTTSDYEKYQQSNFANAMENRWNKYKQDTQSAIDLAKNRNMTEEEAYDTVKKISRNQRLQTAFNMMNEDQKLYLMNVTKEIGDKIGSFDNKELIDFLTGAAVSGDKLTWQEAAAIAVARFGPDVYKAAKEGKGKVEGDEIIASFGGGNKKGATLSDGSKVNPGMTMSKEELKELQTAAENLGNKYYNGEITEEEFRKDYAKLEDVMSQHGIRGAISGGIKSQDDYIKQIRNNKLNELDSSFEELNKNAGSGSYKDYLEEYGNLISNAKKWGASEKMIKSLESKKLTEDKYNKAVKKANKKK